VHDQHFALNLVRQVIAVVKEITWQTEFKELTVRRAAMKDEKTRQALHV
jgi:hypothetical protein